MTKTVAYDYSGAVDEPQSVDLAEVTNLVNQLARAKLAVAAAEQVLKKAQAEEKSLSEHKLPEAMELAGLTELSTAQYKVTIKDSVHASIPKAVAHESLAWLRKHGFGALIKHEFKLAFGRDEDSEAAALKKLLAEHNLHANETESVHSSTLKAFVKEQLAAGSDMPQELFGVYTIRQAVLK